jgi:hypothetical protein
MENFLLASLLSLSFKASILFPIFLFTSFGMLLFKGIAIFVATYAVSGLLFFVASRKLGFNYTVQGFTAYYFFYAPVSTAVFLLNFSKVLAKRNVEISDWKVSA